MNPSHKKSLRKLIIIAWVMSMLVTSAQGGFDHSLYNSVLKTHVKDGLVDYKALKNDSRLDQYLTQLRSASMENLESRNDKVTFWTNAYNAYTLKLITNYYPVSSIMDIQEPGYTDPWKIPLAQVAGKAYTLDQIENAILRPKWPDPRIHYALVCAALSCPRLRSEAYTAEQLDEQLDDQARWFMLHRNRFDLKSRTAALSKVYEWYAVDFGKNQTEMLRTVTPHVEENLAKALKKDATKWKVSIVEWNWQLNEQK